VASAAVAQTTNTNCTATSAGGSSTNINCTSTGGADPSTYGPTPAQAAVQVEQQKELNDNMTKTGAALGNIIALKRAQHAQEKSDLVAVVYCRQNPTGTWTFSGKAPTPCPTLEKNLTAYCTVNSKNHLCKDVAKLPGPASAPVVADVRQVQPQPQSAQSPAVAQPVQNVVARQPQPMPQQEAITTPAQTVVSQPQVQSQPLVVNASATPEPEVSVAEAARQNKAAKQAQAKENPQPEPPPQQ